MPNPGQKRVIDGGVTQRAGDADALDVAVVAERRAESDDGVFPKKLARAGRAEWIVNEEFEKIQSIEIDLQPQAERWEGTKLALDDLVHV